jgi:hypothetical protein
LLSLLFVLIASAASAQEVDTDFVIRRFNSADRAEQTTTPAYLAGVSDGLVWTNAFMESRKKGALFCMPRNTVLSTTLLMQTVVSYVQRRPEMGKEPFGLTAFAAMQAAYPC